LDSALLRINVSSHALLLLTFFVSNQPAIAAIVEHSQGKDKLLISSLKKIYEAQDLEDELNQERRTNQTFLARIQELTGQRDAECQEKNSKCAHRSL
jgi:restriction endonuclease